MSLSSSSSLAVLNKASISDNSRETRVITVTSSGKRHKFLLLLKTKIKPEFELKGSLYLECTEQKKLVVHVTMIYGILEALKENPTRLPSDKALHIIINEC
jgi:hypothetical protein